jgi:multiple antibiotic resistance protein
VWDLLDEAGRRLLILVQTIVSLYIVVNPPGVASVFLGMTHGLTAAQRRGIAFRAVIAGAIIMVLFAVAGSYLFQWLKITSAALQIAGGIFIFGLGFAMARGKESEYFGKPDAGMSQASPTAIAFYPLAMPMIASPAAIVVIMTTSAKTEAWGETVNLLMAIGVVAALCLLSMLRYLRSLEKMGPAFSHVVPRVMGLVLAIIAVQFIIDGVAAVLPRLAEVIREAGASGA